MIKKNVLITGSGGFIGKNLKEYLKDKYNLLTPRSFEIDLTNLKQVEKYFEENKIDFIIHCASTGGARGIADKDTTVEDNVAMVDNILKYKCDDTRVILFGSGAMYDKSRNLHKVKEDEIGNFVPEDLYGKSKMLIAEKIKNRKDVLMLNIFACYGYGEKESRFPTYTIKRVIENKTIEINQNVIFDYLWVEDMEKIVHHFIEYKPKNNIINITPTKSISILEIAKIVNGFENNKVDIIIKNKVMNNEYTGDNSILLSEIPNIKFTDVKQGLKNLYNYYSSQIKQKGMKNE
ncbi:NAD-dependent epimerase/dehydratase family protein [Candidatus Ruminimicrobium bovinum]|uniref:NAD-dependent epimerase/dehydratase family protein n=1 Tax=Candidatus Ruminimicrobium bovinum TaxID=3242779 RepID=UPI0039B87A67